MKKIIIVFAFFIGLISCSENKNDEMIEDKKEETKELSDLEKDYIWYNINPVDLLGKWKIEKVYRDTFAITPVEFDRTWSNDKIAQIIDFKIDTSYISNTYMVQHIREKNFNSEISKIKTYPFWRYYNDTKVIVFSVFEPTSYPWHGMVNLSGYISTIEFDDETLKINHYNNYIFNRVTYKKVEDYEIDEDYMMLMDWSTYQEMKKNNNNE